MILVTGATGTVGSEVARMLGADAVPVAALVRDRDKAAALTANGIEVRYGDYESPGTLREAFSGVERLFLIAPLVPELADRERNAIDAAARAGVRHIVKLSTAGVSQAGHGDQVVPRQYPLHRRSEEHLERSGIAFTHLRPAPFMQNTLNFAPSIIADGVFRGSWGNGAMGYIDARDVAAVAACVLIAEGHEGKAYELTGPEALSQADVARELSEATGREVRYEDVPPDRALQGMLGRGVPDWFANAMVEVMQHIRTGAAAAINNAVFEITGRRPRSYDEFAHEFASLFRPA